MPAAAASVLLLEFEGVLIETRAMRRHALALALAEEGVAVSERTYDEQCAGLSVRQSVRAAARAAGAPRDETALDLAALRAERNFAAAIGKGVSLAPGAAAFIDQAAGQSRLGIVTRASRREVEFVLGLAGLEAAFECVVAADDAESKPSPAPFLLALARLSRRRAAATRDALAIEDSVYGVRAARAADVACVVVGALPAHHALEADAAIESLDGQTPATIAALAGRRGVHAP